MEPNSTKITDSYISFLHKTNNSNSNINVDVSFSSYLKPAEPKPINRRLADQDTEISIFDAHKYFNETVLNESNDKKKEAPFDSNALSRPSNASSADCSSYGTRSDNRYKGFRSCSAATPVASSEASWNSQTCLLSHPPGTTRVSIRDQKDEKKKGLASKWFFRRKCPCSCKKSVQVQESGTLSPQTEPKPKTSDPLDLKKLSEPVIGIHQTITAEQKQVTVVPSTVVVGRGTFENPTNGRGHTGTGTSFSFPVVTEQPSFAKIRAGCLEDPPRDSLEVFQPRQNRSVLFPASPKSNRRDDDDADASDASSDLFEIESFATHTTSYANPIRRDSMEDTLAEITEYCYEPSEASIAWSVTTAEPASVSNISAKSDDVPAGMWSGGGKRRPSGNGLLLSCRCEKAVMVSKGPRSPKSVGSPSRAVPFRPVPGTAGTALRPPLARNKYSV